MFYFIFNVKYYYNYPLVDQLQTDYQNILQENCISKDNDFVSRKTINLTQVSFH